MKSPSARPAGSSSVELLALRRTLAQRRKSAPSLGEIFGAVPDKPREPGDTRPPLSAIFGRDYSK